jgi:hypothetical protein
MMQRPPDQGTGWHAGRSARVSDATEASEVPGLGVARDEHVLRLRLQRPEKRNSLTHEMIAGLIEQLELAALDDEIRAIALTAQGEHFCTGADIVAINREGAPKPAVGSIQRRLPIQAHRLIPLLLNTQKLVVCGVRGFASGIGLHLALAADFTIAASDARFWEPFSTRGFTVDSGGSWLRGSRAPSDCCCSARRSRAPMRPAGDSSTTRSPQTASTPQWRSWSSALPGDRRWRWGS